MNEYFELRDRNKDHLGSLYSLNLSGDSGKIAEVKDLIKAGLLPDRAEVFMEIDPQSGTGKKRLGDVVFWQ